MDHERDRRSEQEAVTEDRKGVSIAPVEPDEEETGHDEMAREVEPVGAAHKLGITEKGMLHFHLPIDVQHALDLEHVVSIRERDRPVGGNQAP